MKKSIIITIVLAIMSVSFQTAFATDEIPVLISAPIEIDGDVLAHTITVNGKIVDFSNIKLPYCLYKENENIMVPVRAVAQAMGYSVEWNAENKEVSIENDTWKVVFRIGKDDYYGVTKIEDAVGMTAPQKYGIAPQLVENTTFVPAKMFELMGYTYNFEPPYLYFNDESQSVQIPNSFVPRKSLKSLMKK